MITKYLSHSRIQTLSQLLARICPPLVTTTTTSKPTTVAMSPNLPEDRPNECDFDCFRPILIYILEKFNQTSSLMHQMINKIAQLENDVMQIKSSPCWQNGDS